MRKMRRDGSRDAYQKKGRGQGVVAHEEHAQVARKADEKDEAYENLRHGGVHEGLAAELKNLLRIFPVPLPVGQGHEDQEDAAHGHGRDKEVQESRESAWARRG